MIQRSNPRVIGGFVLGGVALLVAAILMFGSGQLFRKYEKAVIFFKGSVGGLRVGALVNFRGVQIGTVQDISIQYDVQTSQFSIPVIVDIDPSRVKGVSRNVADRAFTMQTLIERGLRAELRQQSFVTGQMDVLLDFHPGAPAQTVSSDLPYPEIPAIASTFEQATEILTELAKEAPEIVKRLNLVLDRAASLLVDFSDTAGTARVALVDLGKFSKALGDSDEHIRNTLVTIDKLATNLDRVALHADTMTLEFGDAGKRLNRILADNDGTIKTMLAQTSKAATGLGQLSDQLNHLVTENRDGLKDFTSSGLYDLTNLIRDTQDMVGNLNRTIDELRRNPSQFLFGQQQREVPANRSKTP
jgi:paraquat-inducible protein B